MISEGKGIRREAAAVKRAPRRCLRPTSVGPRRPNARPARVGPGTPELRAWLLVTLVFAEHSVFKK